jgi:hypothetical protein
MPRATAGFVVVCLRPTISSAHDFFSDAVENASMAAGRRDSCE